jgi:cytochrome c peroxidase
MGMPRASRTLSISGSTSASAISSSHRRRAGLCLVLLLLTAGMPARTPDPQTLAPQLLANEEPITPVPLPPVADPLKLALGERLFADTRLSADGSRACISCHDTHTNGASANRLDRAVDGAKLPLNTSTVFNASLSFRLNWEGSFRTLEAQAESALDNQRAMGRSIDEILRRLSADPELRRQFGVAYGHGRTARVCWMLSRPMSGRC